jgi:O-antigen/teichoic acid export membrane protein
MFDKFSLPDLARVSRRTVIGALVIGIVGLAVCMLLNATLVGLGLCVGLALGILNFRMVQRAVVKAGDRAEENRRRPLALNTLARLGAVSVVALGFLFLSFDLGLGVMGGLAVFELLLLANVARSMMKMGGGLLPLGGGAVGTDSLDEPDGGI